MSNLSSRHRASSRRNIAVARAAKRAKPQPAGADLAAALVASYRRECQRHDALTAWGIACRQAGYRQAVVAAARALIGVDEVASWYATTPGAAPVVEVNEYGTATTGPVRRKDHG